MRNKLRSSTKRNINIYTDVAIVRTQSENPKKLKVKPTLLGYFYTLARSRWEKDLVFQDERSRRLFGSSSLLYTDHPYPFFVMYSIELILLDSVGKIILTRLDCGTVRACCKIIERDPTSFSERARGFLYGMWDERERGELLGFFFFPVHFPPYIFNEPRFAYSPPSFMDDEFSSSSP